MFFSGSISAAMEEVNLTCRPLIVFVVPREEEQDGNNNSTSPAPFGAADVFDWCSVGHYHLTGIVHIVTEGTEEFKQLNAVTPQKQVPRVHIIPHQASTQLPPTCLFGSGITFPHVSSMIALAGRPAEAVVNSWESDLLLEAARVTSEGNRTKRSQGKSMTAIQTEEAAAKALRVSLRLAQPTPNTAVAVASSSSSSTSVAPPVSVVVARDALFAEATRLAAGKQFHITCGSSSASTSAEVETMTLFNNAVVYVHVKADEPAPKPEKKAVSPTGKRDRAEPPSAPAAASSSSSLPATSTPSSGEDVLSLRITEGSGKQYNWEVSPKTTVGELFSRVRADILEGSPMVFNLVIAYPARRLGASDFPQVLGAGGLGLRGRGAMRLVPVVAPTSARAEHVDPNGSDNGPAAVAPAGGAFGKMASMVGGWLGGRTVAQPAPVRVAVPPPTNTRMTLGELNRRQAEEKDKEEGDGSNNRYFNGVSTEFDVPPKKKGDAEEEERK